MNPWNKTLVGIKSRCNHPVKNYGAKGVKAKITVDELKFLWFRDKAYSMKIPSIDRIDSNGDYEIGNCRYIELSENTIRIKHPEACPKGHTLFSYRKQFKAKKYYVYRTCIICRRTRWRPKTLGFTAKKTSKYLNICYKNNGWAVKKMINGKTWAVESLPTERKAIMAYKKMFGHLPVLSKLRQFSHELIGEPR